MMKKLLGGMISSHPSRIRVKANAQNTLSLTNACTASSKPPVGSELSMCRGCPRALKVRQKPIKLVYMGELHQICTVSLPQQIGPVGTK